MKPYPLYKDSRVEWIGEIPSDWEIGKLYQYGSLLSGSTPLRNELTYWENGSIPWMSSGEINKRIIKNIDGKITEIGHKNSNTPMLPVHTVMMGLNGQGKTKGTVGILEVKTTCNQSLCGIIFNKSVIPYFQFYYLDSQYYHLRGLVGEGKREGLSVSFLKRFPTLVPPISEQTQIVSFLDTKTQIIDELIEKTEKKIELLKEKRTSLINHCVTKGLNPNVKMKDSGIEWIGEIPKTWKRNKLWIVVTNSDLGGNYNSSPQYDGIPLIKMGNMGRGKVVLNKIEFVKKDEEYDENHLLNKGDFLFNTRNSKELVGKVTLWKEELKTSLYNSNILRINFRNSINNEYMSFLFNSSSYIHFLRLLAKGTTSVSGIYYKDLSQLDLLIPPLTEQTQIVEYLDKQTQKINSTIEKETQRIELLKEYRQSLISEVVTGKVDVRDWKN